MPVIEVAGLRKVYRTLRGRTVAVDGLDMEVPEGGVFGFLGPNGSGKTTTIRCLLGLSRPTSGRTRLLGAEPRRLGDVMSRVGSIVEAPALFPTFSGRRNLRLLGAMDGIGPRTVDTVLERVGLGDRGDDKFSRYSLGMKQRLAIGAALLKDPALLILDEPANGLDPAGIKEVRLLLRSLGHEGRTVFVSSHLLSEVQQTCDRVAILTRGRCIATGLVSDVLRGGETGEVLVRAADTAPAVEALRAAGFETRVLEDGGVVASVGPERAEDVARALLAGGVFPTELRPLVASLEDVFLELTEEQP